MNTNPYESPTHCESKPGWTVAKKTDCLKGVLISCAIVFILGLSARVLAATALWWLFWGQCFIVSSLIVAPIAVAVWAVAITKD